MNMRHISRIFFLVLILLHLLLLSAGCKTDKPSESNIATDTGNNSHSQVKTGDSEKALNSTLESLVSHWKKDGFPARTANGCAILGIEDLAVKITLRQSEISPDKNTHYVFLEIALFMQSG
ncbi:MAG: hypothetical protein GY757_27870, partial [bacterium]|nr:hypothetical protein [bacterium]